MARTDRPLLISDQTVFCFWLSGEDNEQVVIMLGQVNNEVFTSI
jgi:hypothetical protein